MIIWRVGLRTLGTPTPHPRIVVGTHRKSCHYPQHLRSFTKNRNLEIGSTMFMVWVSSWNKCDAARHHKVNRPYSDVNLSTSSHLTPLFFTPLRFLQRTHAEENYDSSPRTFEALVGNKNRCVSKRSFPRATFHEESADGTQATLTLDQQ